jgi:ribosomal protein L11 methyltransferase
MTPRFRQLVVGAVLAFAAQHVLADFTCKAQANGWVAPACQSPEVRRLVDQVTAASESLGCDARQRLELKAIQSAWGREQAACRLHDDGAHCTQASLKAELRYLRETRRCDVNARPVRASSPDASYVALHPNTYRDAQVSVTGQMFVDDCKPGARSTSGSVREGETGPAVPEQDWVRLTQSQFSPVEITPSFWIVPSWHQAPPAATRVMRLDPGLAFGTGTHPTTRMCLRWIAQHAELAAGWDRVLDYGCGSGILAIGAALHGAQHIDAVDIDPAALRATADNAAANATPQVHAADPASAAGTYPLVLANILASPLKLLAPLLCAHVAPGGHLVLAGILAHQADDLKAAYAPWLALEVSEQDEGWIRMTAQRKS